MYLIGTEFKVTQRDNNSFYSIIMANEGHAQDSLVVEFGEEEVHLYLASQDSVGLKIYADSIQLNINGDKITWDGTYWRTATDTTAWLSDLLTHTSDVANPHAVTKTQVGLGNVTDDAQLKRASADFNSFTVKSEPVDADVLLIEDSEASYAKKKVLYSSLPGGELNIKQEAIDTVRSHIFEKLKMDSALVYNSMKVGNGEDSLILLDSYNELSDYINDVYCKDNVIVAACNNKIKTFLIVDNEIVPAYSYTYTGENQNISADNDYIYVVSSTGVVRRFILSNDGQLTYIDFYATGMVTCDVFCTNNTIYVCGNAGLFALHIQYLGDEYGSINYIDFNNTVVYCEQIWAVDSFIYMIAEDGLNSFYLGSDDELHYVDNDLQGAMDYKGVSGDGTFIYVTADDDGILSYSSADGVLTYLYTKDDGSYYTGIWCDESHIYAGEAESVKVYYTTATGEFFLLNSLAVVDWSVLDIFGNDQYLVINRFWYIELITKYEYSYYSNYMKLTPRGHLPSNPRKGMIVLLHKGYFMGYDGAEWDTLNSSGAGASGAVYKTISFFCTSDSIAEVTDSVGYGVITADFTGMDLTDMQVSSFNNADRIVTIDAYRIRGATTDKMTSTGATLGAQYTISDETIDTSYDDVEPGDIIYVKWSQGAGTTRHKGLFVGLDFQ